MHLRFELIDLARHLGTDLAFELVLPSQTAHNVTTFNG